MWIIASRRSEGGFSHGGSGLSGTAPFRDCSCNCSCRACSHSVWGIKELACHGIAISVWAPNLASPYLLGAANRRAHAIAQRIAIRVTRSSPSTSTRQNSLLMISTSSPPGRRIAQRPDETSPGCLPSPSLLAAPLALSMPLNALAFLLRLANPLPGPGRYALPSPKMAEDFAATRVRKFRFEKG